MSNLVLRLLAAIGVLIFVPISFAVVLLTFRTVLQTGIGEASTMANVVTAVFFVPVWILLWRPVIPWNRTRRIWTALSVVGALVPAVSVVLLLELVKSLTRGTLLFRVSQAEVLILAGLAWLASWIALTALIWRETPEERSARLAGRSIRALACPKCGYNLTGLEQARCPECGTQYTLDSLFAALIDARGDLDDDEDKPA